MENTELTQLKQYEMLYIISNKYSENELPPVMEKVQKIIEAKNGKIINEAVWGKKKLAYPIKGMGYGYYILLEFDVESNQLNALDNLLRIDSDLIRYQIVKRIAIVEGAKAQKIRKPAAEGAVKKETKAPEKTKQEIDKEAKKVDLKDLDEKLDKILDVDSLL